MSSKIWWDENIYPNEFRNMSMKMAEIYRRLETSEEEDSLKKERAKLEESMGERIIDHVYSLDKHYNELALLLSIFFRFVGAITMLVMGCVIYEFDDLVTTLCIILPILILNKKLFKVILKLLSNYRKKEKEAKRKDEEATLKEKQRKEEEIKDIDRKLKVIQDKRTNAYKDAEKYSFLYEVWKDQVDFMRIANVPWTRESSYIDVISQMVTKVEINCFEKKPWLQVLDDAVRAYKENAYERERLVKEAQAMVRSLFS